MFIPVGDDVQKREFPAVGMIFIALCFVVFMYQNRLWNDFVNDITKRWSARDYRHSRYDEQTFKALQDDLISSFNKSEYMNFNRRWGASESNLKQGHFMSLVTHQFLHGGLVHFIGNMIVLWAFVGTLENVMGAGLFFFCYILWGVAAGAAHVFMDWGGTDPTLPLIGASGAISGMIGAYFLAFGALTRIRCLLWFIVPLKTFYMPAGFFVFIWVLSQISGLDDDQKYGKQHVAWWAHLGGFAAGAFTMACMRGSVLARLNRDEKTGELRIEGEDGPRSKLTMKAAEEQPVAAPSAFPVCPTCGTELAEEHRIHDTLFRCPKDGCKRLVMHNI